MPKQALHETAVITETAAAEAKKTGRMLVQHISPGWGSSGYYSSDVLEQAAADEIIPAGTHMYADHPTDAEIRERPVRSIKDLMSITTEAARVATEDDVARGAELGALVSEVDVVPTYRDLVEHLKDAIGVSIRGDGELVQGTAEGRSGKIVESLEHVKSVDWVTRAGRGGKVLSLVESARANERAIGHGISEATVNDTREALQNVLRDAHGSEDVWVWVRDFDDTTVWFELESGDDAGVYGQGYTTSAGGDVALTGDRAEVRVVTTYVPAGRPDNPTAKESKEDTMPNIEESELARLREEAGRATALEERATTAEARAETAERERDEARGQLTEAQRDTRARTLIGERAEEADVEFDDLQVDGLLARMPLTEDGALDEAAFTTAVDEQAAKVKARSGAGRVHGFGGGSGESGSITWDDIDEAAGLEKKGA